MGGIIQKDALVGKYVTLREVTLDDVDFILKLRCDEKKSQFLHKTENDKEKQKQYLKRYFEIDNEWYFIAEDKNCNKLGTYRIYDIKGDSFCHGSWLMIDGATVEQTYETDYLGRNYAFEVLKFKTNHFDVRKGNRRVLRYSSMMGAKQVGETELDVLWLLTKEDFYEKVKLMNGIMG